jgi:hypothetical protein
MNYTIAQIEQAINIWRARQASGEDGALCAEARALAEPYTLMFLSRRDRIAASELTPEQQQAVTLALGPRPAG